PLGKIFIRAKDFAILKMEYSYVLNPKKRGTIDYEIFKSIMGSDVMFSTTVMYREIEGKMYLMYMRKKERDPVSASYQKRRESGYTEGYFFMERELLVNEILTSEASITRELNKKNWGDSLYTEN